MSDCSDYNKIPQKPKLNYTKKTPPTNLSCIKMKSCLMQLIFSLCVLSVKREPLSSL